MRFALHAPSSVAPVNSVQQFRVLTREAGRAEFAVVITGPSGGSVSAQVVPAADGYVVHFTPTELGEYRLGVTLGGEPVPRPGGGPYRMTCTQASDPSKVTARGPGLSGGLVDRPAEFIIDTKRAGQGGLGVTVEGPSEAAINCRDNGDGTCSVAYMPRDAGDYVVNITFNDRPIPGSPFNALVVAAPTVNNVRASGNGLLANGNDQAAAVFARARQRCCVQLLACSPTNMIVAQRLNIVKLTLCDQRRKLHHKENRFKCHSKRSDKKMSLKKRGYFCSRISHNSNCLKILLSRFFFFFVKYIFFMRILSHRT